MNLELKLLTSFLVWYRISPLPYNFHMIFICALCVLVKEKLAHDPDSEIATTCLRVSLTCPVSYNQIRCNQMRNKHFAVNQDKKFHWCVQKIHL